MSVGKNVKHDSSLGHVTGKSVFIDDRSMVMNELLVGVVGAPKSCGKIKTINFEEALKVEGVIGIYSAGDLAHNEWGTIVAEQPILVDKIIGYFDEPVLAIAGEDENAIAQAKKLITFDIEEETPVYSIEQALEKERYISKATPFTRGDFEKEYQTSAFQLESEFECGGQEHFYMENQASIVYPMENDQYEVHSSSQHPSETQRVVAEALGVKLHQVVCIVKRMGGAFGGKESQAAHFAAIAALVAKKTQRPARINLTKDDDMRMTGKRHPFKIKYKVGYDQKGKIHAFKADIYCDGGAYTDLTPSILERAMFHIDNGYYLPVCEINGYAMRTNNHSNTAFRGFGGPQGAFAMENAMEEMAQNLGLDSKDVREVNLYGSENNITPYGQRLDNNQLPVVFKQVVAKSDYENRAKKIELFNATNKYKARGISLTTTKFGIAFTARFLNQGNALVNLHLDGTVQVSTGATEMGQGVNTKIAQVVADCFGIKTQDVKVMPTSTEKNHNTSPTAASSGADINCAAAQLACDKIKKRLIVVAHKYFNEDQMDNIREWEIDENMDPRDYKFSDGVITCNSMSKEAPLTKIIEMAYMNRISLGDYAHFKTKGLGFDKQKGIGKPFNYFTNGAAVSEVEVDLLTGEVKVLRSDIVMDLGRMINPGIDEGQVSGAFVQAMGWVTTENLFYNKEGRLMSHSPTTYKIPNIQDIPREFNIHFIENDANDVNIRKSKAVGEPPFLLGISVWTAIKKALMQKAGKNIAMKSPATNEQVLMSIQEQL